MQPHEQKIHDSLNSRIPSHLQFTAKPVENRLSFSVDYSIPYDDQAIKEWNDEGLGCRFVVKLELDRPVPHNRNQSGSHWLVPEWENQNDPFYARHFAVNGAITVDVWRSHPNRGNSYEFYQQIEGWNGFPFWSEDKADFMSTMAFRWDNDKAIDLTEEVYLRYMANPDVERLPGNDIDHYQNIISLYRILGRDRFMDLAEQLWDRMTSWYTSTPARDLSTTLAIESLTDTDLITDAVSIRCRALFNPDSGQFRWHVVLCHSDPVFLSHGGISKGRCILAEAGDTEDDEWGDVWYHRYSEWVVPSLEQLEPYISALVPKVKNVYGLLLDKLFTEWKVEF